MNIYIGLKRDNANFDCKFQYTHENGRSDTMSQLPYPKSHPEATSHFRYFDLDPKNGFGKLLITDWVKLKKGKDC